MEYLLLYGSSDVIKYCLDNLYEFKTLREFQYIDDNGIDQGHNVRQIAKAITNMLLSPSTIRAKRNGGGGRRSYDDLDTERSRDGPGRGRPTGSGRSSSFDGDDSRREVVPRKRAVTESDATTSEDRDLLRAIELSKAEEEKRRKAVAAASSTVFNDFEQLRPFKFLLPNTPTHRHLLHGTYRAKKDDPLIDLSDIQMSPPAPLQVQYTQLQPQYTVQPQLAVQPQYTSLPPQFTSLQPQYTPFQPQFTQGSMYDLQMQQEAMQVRHVYHPTIGPNLQSYRENCTNGQYRLTYSEMSHSRFCLVFHRPCTCDSRPNGRPHRLKRRLRHSRKRCPASSKCCNISIPRSPQSILRRRRNPWHRNPPASGECLLFQYKIGPRLDPIPAIIIIIHHWFMVLVQAHVMLVILSKVE